MQLSFEVDGGDFTRAGYASSQIKKTLKGLNIDPAVIRRVVVALYEAEVNVVAHAYKGIITVSIDPCGISVRLEDEGPGIPDIELAMTRGYSTASAKVREMGFGAGMGLSNIKENSDNLSITSKVGKGTVLDIYFKLV